MARIIPDGWRELSVTGAAQREIETLGILEAGLPDDYAVYHAVHWTAMDGRYAIYGEVDFAVVNRAGDLLLSKLFVGATRSMMRLTLILHEKSAAKLLERIG